MDIPVRGRLYSPLNVHMDKLRTRVSVESWIRPRSIWGLDYLGTSTHSTKVEKSTDFDLLGLGSFDLSTSSSSNKSTSGSDTHSSSSKLLILRNRLLRIPIDFSFRLFQTSILTKIKFDIEREC